MLGPATVSGCADGGAFTVATPPDPRLSYCTASSPASLRSTLTTFVIGGLSLIDHVGLPIISRYNRIVIPRYSAANVLLSYASVHEPRAGMLLLLPAPCQPSACPD
ncbi:hypothetical protein LIA77_08104 [Sarocladium implicatum]|nr:hypothetical protein LIA77_08104 [Sarocladium implicatum]